MSVRDRELRTPLTRETLSGNRVRRVALPRYSDDGDLLRFLRAENLPGRFPFTAGVFPFRREGEDPARMFAGEGDAFRTNRRFHLLSEHSTAKRLSTAFDSVTLYGRDPDTRPDVHGKIGTSGVSIATLDDMKALYAGFDLCSPTTSVSMTINGPAPTILAYFLNTAIDQQVAAFVEREGREPSDEERAGLTAYALANVRGTVQADILKEDQGQNTCIFSTEFSLRMMADIQEWFIAHQVRNFYSVSISGYHIAEAGANPISQLAFTLANGFTYVEAYLARGMKIDDFAPNLSFFFSNGMDAEYTVIGRVARRIWAVAMRERYGANERRQKLKYHVQTSGRSLHAQEMDFNDIRTTLQALCALYDNANSLHTNAFDEAVTTPTESSVRRAMAIQLIIGKEWGLSLNENPLQGSFVVDELTDLVEEAVLAEFDRIAERGGRAGCHGDRLPAWPDPGRVDALRAPQARRVAADRRGEHLRPRERRGAGRRRAGPGDRGGEAEPARPARRLPHPQRERCRGGAAASAGRGDERGERVRRADARGAGVLAGPADGGVLRGGWAVPAQRVALARAVAGEAGQDGAVDDHRGVRRRRVRRHRVRRGADGRAPGRARAAGHADRAGRAVARQAGRGPRRAARRRSDWPLLEADATDPASLAALAAATRVVVTTVGPYARYGLPLVEACARAGTHYADLTGEVLFVREAIRFDDAARESARGSCTPAASTRSRRTWRSCCCTSVRRRTARAGCATSGWSRPCVAASAAGRSTRSASRSTRCGATPRPAGSPPTPSR